MSDPTNPLAAALRASLRIVEDPTIDPDSPLSEATVDSVNILLDEINNALAEGMPERITDDKLAQLVDIYRAQALTWATTEEDKKNKPRGKRAPKGNIIDITL
jgi:hypothetical protein